MKNVIVTREEREAITDNSASAPAQSPLCPGFKTGSADVGARNENSFFELVPISSLRVRRATPSPPIKNDRTNPISHRALLTQNQSLATIFK